MGLLAATSSIPIYSQIVWLLGMLMNGIYNALSSLFGIENIGLCIIIFTIILYTLMIPLVIKQQKFTKMSSIMNPELQAVQKKYAGKKDQDSMMKQQEETQMVYQKYGTSPTGGCLVSFIQFPILIGLYSVLRNLPTYVTGVRNVYSELISDIMATSGYQKVMEKIGEAAPILIKADKFDYSQKSTLVDVFYKFQSGNWADLADKFPKLTDVINSTQTSVSHINNFLGINIAESPWNLLKSSWSTGTHGGWSGAVILGIIGAIIIPVLAGLTQWMSIKLMSSRQMETMGDNPMANSMKTMNLFMPLFSVWMCFTLQSAFGLYWIASAVVRTVQQVFVNKHLDKIPVEDMIAENQEKAKKKREKKGVNSQTLMEMATKSTRQIEEPKKTISNAEKETLLKNAEESGKNAKAGSLASKANMVQKFNSEGKEK